MPSEPISFAAGNSFQVMPGETAVIPVLRETAQVHAVLEHTGTVRVRKEVRNTPQPVSTQGYCEVVETTRLPLDQVVEVAEQPRTVGDVLVIPVYEERLVRQLVLVEEIHVRRVRVPVEQRVDVVLKSEEAIVERLDSQTGQWVIQPL